MPWLTSDLEEVKYFHAEFESAANEALIRLGIEKDFVWVHHQRTYGVSVIPDFVLMRVDGGQWLLSIEIKRTLEAVYSTRNQIQAQGYATTNQSLYAPGSNKYFIITNLEDTLLFCLNGTLPPRECLLENGKFKSGRFFPETKEIHRENFIIDMMSICEIVLKQKKVRFEVVWPSVLSDYLNYANSVPSSSNNELDSENWNLVESYFGNENGPYSGLILILRCLMLEYLRGTLLKHNHPKAKELLPLRENKSLDSIARSISAIRKIDFDIIFEEYAPDIYRNIKDKDVEALLSNYIKLLNNPTKRIVELALSRIDSYELIDSLMTSICTIEDQGNRGKVPTDPELARLLAFITITSPNDLVIDPCAGDGSLISAAYERLMNLGSNHDNALSSISGIEADAIAVRLASIRMALKRPATLTPQTKIQIQHGDMFSQAAHISKHTIVLMNPPFKRYEAQDDSTIPIDLKSYYSSVIKDLDGKKGITISGQANLYNYYIEFISKAIKPGTRIGFIIDNKWYHSSYGKSLRNLLLSEFEIEGILEYPHGSFFSSWTIATSILLARRLGEGIEVNKDHNIKFIRSKVDPRESDLELVADAFNNNADWPLDWSCNLINQNDLNADNGWKGFFASPLLNDFRLEEWPTLGSLFQFGRRGSLNKEEGGIKVFEFPFNISDYGPRRTRMDNKKRRFQTQVDRQLNNIENQTLKNLADKIPIEYRGYAIKNSNGMSSYILSEEDVLKQPTLEPPIIREKNAIYFSEKRVKWGDTQKSAISQLRSNTEVNDYISQIENIVNLNENTLTEQERFIGLCEPTAGELILPRKVRSGHRIHINKYAFDPDGRQVRISSNFITYGNCINDATIELSREQATLIISAFLMSSFGQLQFEIEGYNREGMLALEKQQFDRMKIFDPRWVRTENRALIIDAFLKLPYPIMNDKLTIEQKEKIHLDQLFASEIANKHPQFDENELLNEVHCALDEWLEARRS